MKTDPSVNDSIEEKLKEVLRRKNSYIALMTERLDIGGLEEVIKTLALEYQKRGIPVRIFCTKKGGQIADALKDTGIEVVIFHGDYFKFVRYINKYRPVLVNTHYVADFLSVLKYKRIPVVEVIHNMYVFLDKRRIRKEQAKTEMVRHYIAVSESARTVFQEKVKNISDKKITVIGNAVSRYQKVKRTKEETRERYGFARNTFIFLAAGSIDARKNQIGIIRAWDIFRTLVNGPVLLVFAGAITDGLYADKVKSVIHSKRLEESVRYIGYCEEMTELMHSADALIVDSYYEGWSMAATEALYCGLPLIHSMCGSGKELTAKGQNGILIDNPLSNLTGYDQKYLINIMRTGVNKNIDQLVCAMRDLYENREAWKQKRSSIAAYADHCFDINTMIEKYLKVYLQSL